MQRPQFADLEGAEVDVSVTPAPVSTLALVETGLSGRVPPELGSIFELTQQDLTHHYLTGEMRTELVPLSILVDLLIG